MSAIAYTLLGLSVLFMVLAPAIAAACKQPNVELHIQLWAIWLVLVAILLK